MCYTKENDGFIYVKLPDLKKEFKLSISTLFDVSLFREIQLNLEKPDNTS